MSIDNYLKSNCEYEDIEMNKQTVEDWCETNGIRNIRVNVTFKRDKNGNIIGKKGMPNPCKWKNNKIPSYSDTKNSMAFNAFSDENYAEYLSKKDDINDHNCIAIDTSKIHQIDFDQPTDLVTIEKLKGIYPWYHSCTKRYPHFFICNDDLKKLKKCQLQFKTKHSEEHQGEILTKQWAFCRKEEFINADSANIPECEINEDSDVRFFKGKKKEVVVNEPDSTPPHVSIMEPLVKDLAEIIDPTIYLNKGCHEKYVQLMWSLHDYRDIAHSLTKKSNSSNKLFEFNTTFDSYDNTKGLDLEYFKKAAKESNEKEYYRIIGEHRSPPGIKTLSTESDMAHEIYKRYGDYWVFQNDTLYRWYSDKKRWCIDNHKSSSGNASMAFIECIYKGWFELEAQKLAKMEKDTDPEKYKQMIKDFQRTEKNSKQIPFLYAVFRMLLNIIAQRRDCVEWDNHPYLFPFDNFVYNFKTRQFSEQLKEYHLFRNVDYKWIEPSQQQMDLLKSIFAKIFYENKDSERVYMSVLRNGLTGWNPEKFVIFNSMGRSGKGLLNEFMLSLLSKDERYGFGAEGGIDTLYGPICTDKANPNLSKLNGKRFMIFPEGAKHKRLCVATIKKLTGGGHLCARGLFSSETSQRLDGVVVFETNRMLQLDENDTSGSACVVRRFMDVKLCSTFYAKVKPGFEVPGESISSEDPEKKIFFENEDLKEATFFIQNRCAFFKYLIDYKNKINDPDDLLCPFGKKIYVSQTVAKRTKAYLDDSDYFKDFIEENIEVGCEEKEKINKTTLTYNSESDKDFVLISDIYKRFIESEHYKSMEKQQQRSVTRKVLKKYIEEHSEYSKYYLPLFTFHYGKRQNQRNVMRPWKWKESEDNCIISEDELDN